MAYTSFGEFVRILRVKHHQVMGDMAEALGTSLPFLSAVENGKKNVPSDWMSKLTDMYKLSDTEQKQLEEAIEESKTQYKIITGSAGKNQRRAAMQFARSFDEMDDDTAVKIIKLLSKEEEKKDNGL
ncbi:MAG: helix-turn-helix transcriptional regulator [Lachnospiraceae bacterium]|nr:helix-turn-helix transcriptional regulator [Lachnospiraceae bacterium]